MTYRANARNDEGMHARMAADVSGGCRVTVWWCASSVTVRHFHPSRDRGYRVCTGSQQRGAADEEDKSKIRPGMTRDCQATRCRPRPSDREQLCRPTRPHYMPHRKGIGASWCACPKRFALYPFFPCNTIASCDAGMPCDSARESADNRSDEANGTDGRRRRPQRIACPVLRRRGAFGEAPT